MSTPKVRINKEIRAAELRVIGPDGGNLGVITFQAAMDIAKAAGVDLIEVSPGANPPVAKIMDYGKFQYEQQKKDREIRAKSHVTETKSVQIEVGTGENDLMRKARQSAGWLKEGHRVRIELFLKGRYKYMDQAFLKERLKRFVLLVPEEYRIAEDVQRGPKGFTIIIEKAGEKSSNTNKNSMKANKSYLKRIRVTRNGKLVVRKAGQNHFNAKESRKTKTAKRRTSNLVMKAGDRARFLAGS